MNDNPRMFIIVSKFRQQVEVIFRYELYQNMHTKQFLNNGVNSGAPACERSPPTKNLVTYRSKTFWLSLDCPHVCPYADTLKNKNSTISIATTFILDNHVIVN